MYFVVFEAYCSNCLSSNGIVNTESFATEREARKEALKVGKLESVVNNVFYCSVEDDYTGLCC